VHDRVLDLSTGAAKALDFYGKGTTRVRVEFVGRAPLEGSDDKMLLATLRTDTPPSARSKVMVAAAKPLLPKTADGKETRSPSER
jgi:rare lipoprotein A